MEIVNELDADVNHEAEVGWRGKLRHHKVPEHLHDGLVNYLAHHKHTGQCLMAILANDLRGTIERADEATRDGLLQIVSFLTWDAPAIAWGTPAKVQGWLTQEAGS